MQASDQLSWVGFESFRQSAEVEQGQVLAASFDAAYVSSVQTGTVGQLLLRHGESQPCGAYASTKV
jgi:hypothetical protein